ncbi:MAG: hypothetical protein ACJ8AI_04965 [Rhodopila sp.]
MTLPHARRGLACALQMVDKRRCRPSRKAQGGTGERGAVVCFAIRLFPVWIQSYRCYRCYRRCFRQRIAHLQWTVYRRQANIAEETRRLAEAALDRPYVLVDEMFVRFEKGSGGLLPWFDFWLRNYGKGPAIIHHIVAHGFVSSGERGARATDTYPARVFLEPSELDVLLGDRASVRVFPEVQAGPLSGRPMDYGYRVKQGSIVLIPGAKSPKFSHFAKDIHLLREANIDEVRVKVAPWLIGKVTYRDVFGRHHVARFCFRARSDGIAVEYRGPPYNERT